MPFPPRYSRPFGFVSILGLSLALGAACLWGLSDLAAQNPGKKTPPVEEEDPKAGKLKKPPPVEEEDPIPPRSKVPIPVDDGPANKPPSDTLLTTDLTAAAKQTKHPGLHKLYHDLSVPHEELVWHGTNRTDYIEPLRNYYGTNPQFKSTLPVRILGAENFKPVDASPKQVTKTQVVSIEPYEKVALEAVNRFCDAHYERYDENDKKQLYLSPNQIRKAIETVLTAVLRFHEAALENGQREGEGWDGITRQLRVKLLEVHLDQLTQVAATENWDATLAEARRISGSHPRPEEREKIVVPLIRLAQRAATGDNPDPAALREMRRRFDLIEDLFPGSTANSKEASQLEQEARRLFDRAKKLHDENDDKQALELVLRAEGYCRSLPGLHDLRLRLSNAYPILRVGVRELPTAMLPGLAASDGDQLALDLLYESLVEVSREPSGGQGYEPVLATGPPRLIPLGLGRQFQLPRNAFWSSGKRLALTAQDIQHTVKLLQDPAWPGYSSACKELIEEARAAGGDPSRVRITLKRGLFDPLALMTFKVLPVGDDKELTPETASRYAANPVGSGPYKFSEVINEGDRKAAVFVANPNYSARAGKTNLPRIREIHFVQCDDPVKDFGKGDDKRIIDLFVNPTSDQRSALRGVPSVSVSQPISNRRIYFLAVNHERPTLKDDDVRRALAHAINRDKILNECFRGDLGKNAHRALNGPYPAGSWACDPDLGTLDRGDKAKQFAARADKDLIKKINLTVLYDKSDAAGAKALSLLREQVMAEIGVELQLEAREPAALREAVEKSRNYDLAYYHFDFASDSYWLKPLFDQPVNWFNYPTDSQLERLFGQVLSHRDFNEIEGEARSIHGHFVLQMPFIPLWQLDTVVAFHNSVKPGSIDPLHPFAGIETWRMEKK
jgi:peptide/nickel transport system substrate-binding protein